MNDRQLYEALKAGGDITAADVEASTQLRISLEHRYGIELDPEKWAVAGAIGVQRAVSQGGRFDEVQVTAAIAEASRTIIPTPRLFEIREDLKQAEIVMRRPPL